MASARVVVSVTVPDVRAPLDMANAVPLAPSHSILADTGTSTTVEFTVTVQLSSGKVSTKRGPGSEIETVGVGTEKQGSRNRNYGYMYVQLGPSGVGSWLCSYLTNLLTIFTHQY